MPSSVKSTDIPKNPKPLGAGRFPATKLLHQPLSLRAVSKLPGPSCPIR